jgi:sugar phosphate isomerase/epimerase
MKLLLSTGSLYTLPMTKACEIARDTGFDGVEAIIGTEFQQGNPVATIRELQEIIPIYSLHAPFFDIDGWGEKHEQLRLTVRLALETGIPLVNFHPPSWLAVELRFWRWFQAVKDYQLEIGQGQVLITVENMPCSGAFKINPYLLSQTGRLIEFLRRHNLYLTFDTTHMGSGKTNFLWDFHQCYDSGRMRNIHFSDYGNDREHLLPGHGVLPLTRFLNHLRETEYNETLTLELSPYEFPRDEAGIRRGMAEVFTYLQKETGRSKSPG